jgi:exo-1,4-beta-D-glucosaminidase
LNDFGDRTFKVNGERFLPLGGGYAPDMFMRWDSEYVRRKFELMLDLGMNTVRLEGKQEHPELFEIADEIGLMIMPGWECCDWWEGWTVRKSSFGKVGTSNCIAFSTILMSPTMSDLTTTTTGSPTTPCYTRHP